MRSSRSIVSSTSCSSAGSAEVIAAAKSVNGDGSFGLKLLRYCFSSSL